MFVMTINRGGSGTGVSLGGYPCDSATSQARVRRGSVAVAGDLPARRAGVQQLT